MKNNQPEQFSNKAFRLIGTLDRKERRRFLKFMASPFFNRSKPLERLAIYFVELTDNGRDSFDRKEAFAQMHEKEVFDDILFRKFSSDLNQFIIDFLAHQRLSETNFERKILAVEQIKNNKSDLLKDFFIKEISDADKMQIHESSSFFYNKYLKEKNVFILKEMESKGNEKFNVEDIFEGLDNFYFIEKLRYFSSVSSQKKVLNLNYDIKFIDPVIQFLIQNYDQLYPSVKFYLKSVLTSLENENLSHYYDLKDLLFNNIEVLDKSESLNFFESLLNYCIGKVNQGKSDFYQEYFDIAVYGLETRSLIYENQINTWQFNNITAISIRLNKTDWATQFVEEYKKYLNEKERDNTVSFCRIRILNAQKKFEEILKSSNEIDFGNVNYSLITRDVIIRAYYELNEFEPLQSFLDTFTVYLNRHKEIPQQRKNTYRTLISFTKKLLKINRKDPKEIKQLKSEIEKTPEFPSKAWLLEKISKP